MHAYRVAALISTIVAIVRMGGDERGRENRAGFGTRASDHRFGLGTLAALPGRPLYERARFQYQRVIGLA